MHPPAAPAAPVPPAAPTAPTPAIAVQDVWRAFGAVQAVAGLTLTAPSGKVTALVGPNGCGKSTLMLMLASLLAPDRGSIRVGGIDPIADPQQVRAMVGWMPDQFGTWDSLKVREVLELHGRAYFLPRPRLTERVSQLLLDLDLESLAGQSAHVLSRGQKQRLGLARALVHDPRVLILDEPASGLDPAARRNLMRIVRNFVADGTRAVLISSHILTELEEMADEVVLMDGGELVQQASVRDLAQRPRPWRIQSLDERAFASALEQLGVRGVTFVPAERSTSGNAEALVTLPNPETAARLLADLTAKQARIVGFGPASGRLESAYLASSAAQRKGAL
ncbi:MAG: ABC transporter ATP-binding protein [Brachybacterium sp.]|nr:ABC transporter ATP-binding protein [Brachybacterium sp.]